jgi:hypothetical protein
MAELNPWLVANNLFLLLCVSIYLGTGVSLVLFQYPQADKLTPDNYYDQFVPQVTVATKFFTVLSTLMLISVALMIGFEPVNWERIFPAIVGAAIVAATVLAVFWELPLNKKMAAHIKDQATLDAVLDEWMKINWIRFSLWSVQWLGMVVWLGVKLT